MNENLIGQLPNVVLAIALTAGEYLLVLFAILADLASGLRKARKRGEARRSKALRRTVEKAATYYNALAALTIIDAMQIAAVIYLRAACGYENIPLFPILTLLGAIGIAIIEVKSIYEKSDEKEQKNFDNAAETILRYLKMINEKRHLNNNRQ